MRIRAPHLGEAVSLLAMMAVGHYLFFGPTGAAVALVIYSVLIGGWLLLVLCPATLVGARPPLRVSDLF